MDPQRYEDCETCYKIICKNCNWEANQDATKKIQEGRLTNCPTCGWSPTN